MGSTSGGAVPARFVGGNPVGVYGATGDPLLR